MRRFFTTLLFAAVVMATQAGTAWGALSDYVLQQGTGTATDMSGSTTAITASASNDDVSVSSLNIGFTFRFDGTNYTQFGISSNGFIVLGTGTPPTFAYTNINASNVNPVIAGFWDDHIPVGNGIRYKLTGSSPNRVLTIEWQTYLWYEGTNALDYHWQVRLYEGSNKIEFLYVDMSSSYTTNGNGQIGAASSSTNYASIAVGSPASVSYTSTTMNNLSSTPISDNTLYALNPCQNNIGIAGNTAEGGTTRMANDDAILVGKQVQRGSSGTFQPFTVSLGGNACADRTATYTITGANAADYQISPTGGTIGTNGSQTPTITFTPSGLGTRTATLTVRDENGFSRNYILSAEGTTRIQWSGTVAQGGTLNANNGDTLLSNKSILRGTTATFTPITVRNFGTNPAAPTAPITATINDPSGQYTLVPPTSASLSSGQSFSPTIRFSPTGVGAQHATLTVVAEGETRVFPLKAFSAAPGGEFFVNNVRITPATGLFINAFGCVGEVANTQQLVVVNTGSGDFQIDGIDFFRTDTTYGQGVPRYPLSRDRFGNVIPMDDYFITDQPGVAPSTANQMPQLPIVIREGESRTLYITYVGQESGKRFARAFIRTNGQNFLGNDPNGVPTDGLLSFDLFAQGIGGTLSDSPTGGPLRTISFQPTRVGDSVDMTYRFYNTGDCNLRVSLEKLGITSGDVTDFRLLSAFGQTIIEGQTMTGDAIIAPDSSGTLVVRFKPQRNGSRRATLWMQTNDSSVVVEGISERGAYYLDLYGFGKAFLDYSNLKLAPAIINSGVASTGTIRVFNSSTASVGIQSITIVGGDAAEFSRHDAAGLWPATPFTMIPGSELQLGVSMTPTGTPGGRATTLRITTVTGEVIDIAITGEAGSQSFTVSPGRLFVGTSIVTGTEARATVMISNTGTLPLRIDPPTIVGAGASEYRLGAFPRLVLEPGATEYLEVTFAPTVSGPALATLTISSGAGTQTVTLEGAGLKTRPIDPTQVATGGVTVDQPIITLNPNSNSTSSVRDAAAAAAGISFEAVRPNPAHDRAELVFSLAKGADVRLELYDGAGRLVREIASGARPAGEHRVGVDVSGLDAGVYHCRLATGGLELTRTVVVVK